MVVAVLLSPRKATAEQAVPEAVGSGLGDAAGTTGDCHFVAAGTGVGTAVRAMGYRAVQPVLGVATYAAVSDDLYSVHVDTAVWFVDVEDATQSLTTPPGCCQDFSTSLDRSPQHSPSPTPPTVRRGRCYLKAEKVVGTRRN